MKTTRVPKARNKARNFALIGLALGLSALAAYPAQASRLLVEKPIEDSRHDDCLSRQEVKWEFRERLDHVNVQKTGERYLYLVSGYASRKAVEAISSDLISKDMSDKVRYVFLYDGCDERIVRQLKPSLKAE